MVNGFPAAAGGPRGEGVVVWTIITTGAGGPGVGVSTYDGGGPASTDIEVGTLALAGGFPAVGGGGSLGSTDRAIGILALVDVSPAAWLLPAFGGITGSEFGLTLLTGFVTEGLGRAGKLIGEPSVPPVGFSTVEPPTMDVTTGMNVGLPVVTAADACVNGSRFRNPVVVVPSAIA